MKTTPPLFLSHGSPMIALEPREAGAFMQALGPAIDATFGRPKAVLVASAHSLTREPVLLAAPTHHAVHDFGGFDPRLYEMRYEPPGAPALAQEVAALLRGAGLPVHLSAEGGLDHGIWTPLRYLYPRADVPVLPLAWPAHWPPSKLLQLGRALAPLRDEGVLVVGSGSLTHNLRRALGRGLHARAGAPATPESTAFRDWFAARGAEGDWAALADYRARAPHTVLMHPTDEHLLPYFIAAGAAGAAGAGAPRAERIHASLEFGDLAMDAYAFGPGAADLAAVLQGQAPAQ
jgi:4,5-DOPA dioxygenase extradiol